MAPVQDARTASTIQRVQELRQGFDTREAELRAQLDSAPSEAARERLRETQVGSELRQIIAARTELREREKDIQQAAIRGTSVQEQREVGQRLDARARAQTSRKATLERLQVEQAASQARRKQTATIFRERGAQVRAAAQRRTLSRLQGGAQQSPALNISVLGTSSAQPGGVGFAEPPRPVSTPKQAPQATPPTPPAFRGTITAATPELQKSLNPLQRPFTEFKGGLREGFTLQEGILNLQSRQAPVAREAGQLLGSLGAIATLRFGSEGLAAAGSTVQRGVNLVTQAPKIQQLTGALQASRTGRLALGTAEFTKDLGVISAQSAAIVEGGKQFRRARQDPVTRVTVTSPQFEQAVRAGLEGQSAAAGQRGFFQGFVSDLNPKALDAVARIPGLERFSLESERRGALEEAFTQQGLTPPEVRSRVGLAEQEISSLSARELVAQLNAARFAEGVGRRAVSAAFTRLGTRGFQTTEKRLGTELFKKTFFPIAKAGAVEGAASTAIAAQSRLEEQSIKNIGVGAGIGALTAGTLGGLIASQVPLPDEPFRRTVTRNILNLGANIADPLEKPGDIAQDIVEFGARRFGRTVAPVPTLNVPNTAPPVTFGTKGRAPRAISLSSLPRIPTIAPATQPKPSTFSNFINTIIPTPSPVPTPTSTPIPVGAPIAPPVPVPITPVVPTPTATVPIVIPTPKSPLFRIPPPLPLEFPLGGGGGGGSRRRQRTFINELALFQQLVKQGGISGLLSGSPQRAAKPKRRRKRK